MKIAIAPARMLALAALMLAVFVPSGLAAKNVKSTIPTSNVAGGIALDDGAGNLWVQSPFTDQVELYGPDGLLQSSIGGTGTEGAQFNFGFSWSQIATDTSGNLYVADSGNNRVQRFDPAGNFDRAWGWGVDDGATDFQVCTSTCQAGEAGSGPGQLSGPQGVAVDPLSGDVFVADTQNGRVLRFSPTGTPLGVIGSSGGANGQLSSPTRVALDSLGRLYVLDLGPTFTGRLQRFDATGDFTSVFAGGMFGSIQEIAVNAADDHLYVAGFDSDDPNDPNDAQGGVFEFDPAANVVDTHAYGSGFFSTGLDLTSGDGPIYVSDGFANRILTLAEVAPPSATIQPVDDISANEATFHGIVNPQGSETAYRFEYSDDGNVWRAATPTDTSVGAGSAGVAVSVTIADTPATPIRPNTDYRVRLIATKLPPIGSITSEETTFATDPALPSVTTSAASQITASGARLGGRINPQNSPTTYHVEYGTDTSYGTTAPISGAGDAGFGDVPITVLQSVTGLQPQTRYHFRLMAENEAGVSAGKDQTFVTAPIIAARGGRYYEKVTPSYKNNGDASVGAILDNDHVGVQSTASFLSGDVFFEGSTRYLATRTGQGWALAPGFVAPKSYIADVSVDHTREVVSQPTRCQNPCGSLLPEDTDTARDVYVRGPEGLELESKGSVGGNSNDAAEYAGKSADASHILFETEEHLEPEDAGRLQGRQLYERVGQQTRVVGVDSDENLLGSGGAVLGHGTGEETSAVNAGGAGSSNPVSADGSMIYFESPDPNLGGDHQLYARIDGTRTVHVSASRCVPAGCAESPQPATFQGASVDGNIVYFTTAGRLLTSDTDGVTDLYRYEIKQDQLTLISDNCEGPQGVGIVDCDWPGGVDTASTTLGYGVTGVSADGRRVYFSAPPVPPGDYGGAPAASGLWLYDAATAITKFVAPVSANAPYLMVGARLTLPTRAARMTPDGGVLVFQTDLQLTSFDNGTGCGGPCEEIYRYRANSDSIDCISCNPAGTQPIGRTRFEAQLKEAVTNTLSAIAFGQRPNQIISADGDIIVFQTGDALLARDTNGKVDVYEWREGEGLFLLTTGVGTSDSALAGITPDGKDVFLSTTDHLTAGDVDAQADLYDARLGTGAAQPASDPPPCDGDQCQPPVLPPVLPQPASQAYTGPGNVAPSRRPSRKKTARRKCKRGYVRKRENRRLRCVKRHTRAKQRANTRRESHRR